MIITFFRHPLAVLVLVTSFVVMAPAAVGGDSGLEKLDTWGRNRGWEGVGYLNIDARMSCTGTLIRPDLVLTAGHCLIDPETGERIDPRRIEFRAGWRGGKSIASRHGLRAVVHPSYHSGTGTTITADLIRNDLALLQLSDPILSTHADPFLPDRAIAADMKVSVVSYGRGRDDAPSRQRECLVLDLRSGVAVMSCDAVPGSSGAPVFALREDRPRIVGVVSAIGQFDGQDVSFAMDVERPLAEIMRALQSGDGVYPAMPTTARRITVGAAPSAGGARFVRP